MYKILIIEDDQIMGEMLAMYLSEEGFDVQTADNGRKGIDLAKEFSPDVILLDMMLPDTSGIELCNELRSFSTVPILVDSMKTEVSERVDALLAGADDYICKPFSMRELTAKIGAMIRRTHFYQSTSEVKDEIATTLSCNGEAIMLDVEKRAIYVNSFFVETTFSEFEIMRLFITNEEKVFSREELLNELRGFDSFVTERAMDVHIANLRKKVEINPKEPKYIKTVWGIGYKFVSKG
ncbi:MULTISPECIES: response regulator transcription factor [Paenibacillus]|jgi:DNA-binding response OmpR family regulator|uniref:Two-component system response regulator n=1 Tax=Paenibacillus etheri TaxID=1306852 RepID=A0A0W1ASE0_9BACL|nr:response regulator transcription factor [Paenibacillus etheri]KTD84176.1 two-component system response regulator [Paenibacillus etheri]